MNTVYEQKGSLKIDSQLVNFVEREAIVGTGLSVEEFWSSLDKLMTVFAPRNRQLLDKRDQLQSKINTWHRGHSDVPIDPNDYKSFLTEIGYLEKEPADFEIETVAVDSEIATLAGPQLVVPVMNARYALNAANARWGSLYDALYGTDVISQRNGAEKKGKYNPLRGEKVIAFARDFLDQVAPLEHNATHAAPVSYFIERGALIAQMEDGQKLSLETPDLLKGYVGDPSAPSQILLRHNGLHIIIAFDPSHSIGRLDRAGIYDLFIEAALTTIMDAEDSVAAVDGNDKVGVYRNWLGLMKGDLEERFVKGGEPHTRRLTDDRTFIAPNGSNIVLPGRSLMLIRNVGHLMTTPAIILSDGSEAPEGLMDALITSLIAVHDLRSDRPMNSRCGSVYVVKPKMHGSDEVAFAVETLSFVEAELGLAANTLKIGIMDEERRTSLNLKACIHAAKNRVAFINTGFLDRTGDEIHTSMEAGPMVKKGNMKSSAWISAYEDRNVKIGLRCGLSGRAQIGKGMWAMPDEMAAMMKEKIAHLEAGANTAWVPSPTAATLHALHYHYTNVFQIQEALKKSTIPNVEAILTLPIADEPSWNEEEIDAELSNNAQGILGYVVRWVEHGVGCSKVPDINDVGLMEDRATLRISSQHIANWLHHGVCSAEHVDEIMRAMAAKVDRQNSGDPSYRPMSRDFSKSIAFQAACALVFEGRAQPSGYTEPLLHRFRQQFKAAITADTNHE